jgi:hypothetical protein
LLNQHHCALEGRVHLAELREKDVERFEWDAVYFFKFKNDKTSS